MISVGMYFSKEEFYFLLFLFKNSKNNKNELWHYADLSTDTHPPKITIYISQKLRRIIGYYYEKIFSYICDSFCDT